MGSGVVAESHPLPPHAIRSPRPHPPRARSLAASFDPPCPPRRFPPPAIRSSPPVRSPRFTFSSPLPSSAARLFLPLADPLHSLPLLNPHPAPRISPPYAWFLPSLPLAAFLRSPPPPSPCPPTLPPLPLASYLPAPPFPPPCAQLLPSLPLPPPRPAPHFPPPHARFLPSPRLPFFLRASPLLPPCPRLPMPLSLASPLPAPRFFPPCPPSAPPLFSPHPLLLPSLPLISRTPALVSYHPCPSFPPFVRSASSLPAPPLLPPCPLLSPRTLPSSHPCCPLATISPSAPAAPLPPLSPPPPFPSLSLSLSLSLSFSHTHAHSPPPPPHPHPPILSLPAPFPPPFTSLTSHLRATGFPPMVPPLHRSPLCSPSARPFSVPSAGPSPCPLLPLPLPPQLPCPPYTQSHPTAPTLPRLPVSALHPRDRVRLPTAQRCPLFLHTRAGTTKTKPAGGGKNKGKEAKGQLTYSPLSPLPYRRPPPLPHIPLKLHPIDGPLPQPMVTEEGRGGSLAQGPHPGSAQPARPTPPSALPPLLPSLAGRHVAGDPTGDVVAPSPIQHVADTLPVAQEGTSTRSLRLTTSLPRLAPMAPPHPTPPIRPRHRTSPSHALPARAPWQAPEHPGTTHPSATTADAARRAQAVHDTTLDSPFSLTAPSDRDTVHRRTVADARLGGLDRSFASGEPEQINWALQTALEGLPPDVLSLLPSWPSCASASPDSLFAEERGHGLMVRGSRGARRESRVEGGSGDSISCGVGWREGQVGRGDDRGSRRARTWRGDSRGRQQQESQRRPRAKGVASPGVGSRGGAGARAAESGRRYRGGSGIGRGGPGSERGSRGIEQGWVGEGWGEGREGEGRGQVGRGEEEGRETIGRGGTDGTRSGQQPAQAAGTSRTHRPCGHLLPHPRPHLPRLVGQSLMVLVDVSIADPQREGNVQLRLATPTQIGVAAARRVQEKLRHWGPHLEGLQRTPHFYAAWRRPWPSERAAASVFGALRKEDNTAEEG
ncbi:unnamed protein product [Closterium sp. Naga37s-1]|nr:unnamed protein product [Closterium sp. Naga37s-1]